MEPEYTCSTEEDGTFVVKYKNEVVMAQRENPDTNTDGIEAWNTGTVMVGLFCKWYPKAAKKRRVRKKWIKRFNAMYLKYDVPSS